mmetsp:Transcript_2144/g.5427  ORF Transcript_2144/g.5427 Transcript_2144/m.5427 type:complete len:375 (-) Transcript_2144:57-1181(-)
MAELRRSSNIRESLPGTMVSMRSPTRPHSALNSAGDRREAERVERICLALAAKPEVPQWARTTLVAMAPLLAAATQGFNAAAPVVWPWMVSGYNMARVLPKDVLDVLYGGVLIFFGGSFTATLAAAEAFRVSGGDRVYASLQDLYLDFEAVKIANAIDNKKDDDGDGTADVDQIDSKALASRKMGIVLKSVNPERIMTALGGLAQALAGVLATLKLQFARTVAIAVSISDNLRKPAGILLTPALAAAMPIEYQHWISPSINLVCKMLAMTVAWMLTRIIAACHSSMLGGLLASRALLRIAQRRGWVKFGKDGDSDTLVDEYFGWFLAFVGIWWQLRNSMSVPFPLNIVLFPFSVTESLLQWMVTWMAVNSPAVV